MASHDDDAPDRDTTPSRQELERIAFARPASALDTEAAADALKRLVAEDRAASLTSPPALVTVAADPVAPLATPHGETDGASALPEAPASADAAPSETTKQRRSLVPLLVVVGVALGLAGGVAFARAAPTAFAAPEPSATTPTVYQLPANSVLQSASTQDALNELAAPQTSRDAFPLTSFTKTLDIEPTSIHRILTTDDGLTLWIGKTSEDICLLFSGPDATSSLDAGSNCATPDEFGTDGLTLSDGRDKWSWDGSGFTTSISGAKN